MSLARMVVYRNVHGAIRALKHWQVFLAIVCLIVLVGYPLYLFCRDLLGWVMPFGDSPAPAIVLYFCYGFWFDAVLPSDVKSRRLRPVSALLLFAFSCASLWLRKDQPSPDFIYIAPLYLLAITWVFLVLTPTVHALRAMVPISIVKLPFWADVFLIAAYFPFGLWVLQPRLNRSQ